MEKDSTPVGEGAGLGALPPPLQLLAPAPAAAAAEAAPPLLTPLSQLPLLSLPPLKLSR